MSEMMGTVWPLEPHTEAKHDILKYYLKAWFPILATTHLRLLYVDGFAGPGEYKGGEDGSPIIALKVAKDHVLKAKLHRSDRELLFFFVEEDEARFHNLNQKIAELQLPDNFKIRTEWGNFENVFGSALAEKIEMQGKRLAPSFVFIDPFGPTGFPLSLIGRIAKQPRSEVLITFNYQDLNRWFLQDGSKHRHVDALYGNNTWRQALNIPNSRKREGYLRIAYQNALESLGWKVRPFRMINRHNLTQYYLFFATSNWRGMLEMKRAMWNAAPTGDFKYSDLTSPEQACLFEELYEKEYSQNLANQLYENRKGQIISKQVLLREDLAWHPTCIESHLAKALKILEYESSPPKISAVLLPNNRKRRQHTYPDDCIIQFVS
jgi:three-Cys-motif partner protein